jgi:hypothetical protein
MLDWIDETSVSYGVVELEEVPDVDAALVEELDVP